MIDPTPGSLSVTSRIRIPAHELEFSAIRAQGAGGQNVNKVASAVHLRFDIRASTALPEACKVRLLAMRDQRISADGIVVIKAQQYRSQPQNKEAALERLRELIRSALVVPKRRKPTKRPKAAERKRLDSKTRHGQLKRSRGKIEP